MDKRLVLALPILAILGLALAPVSQAYTSGVVYLPPSVSFKATYEKTIVGSMQFSVDANSTKSIDLRNYTLPGSIDAVIVKIDSASGQAKLSAKDANGNTIATADIVPLSSGFVTTLPGTTRIIDIQNLATSIWNGTITVVVQSGIDVDLEFQQTSITVVNGQGIASADLVVKNLPEAGSVNLVVYSVQPRASFQASFQDPNDVDNDGKTMDDSFIYLKAHSDPANPVTHPVQVKITTGPQPGTYSVTLRMYYHPGTQLDVDPAPPSDQGQPLGDVSLSVALQDTGSGTATIQPDKDNTIAIPVTWALAVLFLVVIGMILMRMSGK
ncbi:MAG: hypothetical protein GSR84_04515 [Desulfurococcales archaeon]|nr:hypothetical protein [Desulfurococcales archaeon]